MHFTELRLAARDAAALRSFYGDALGLPLLDAPDAALTVHAGATKLVFERDPAVAAPYHFAFNIPENKLAAAKAWLAGRAVLLTQGGEDEFHSEGWDADMLYFEDPAGNVLELIARHTLPNAAPGGFGPRDLLEVSEIGLPVDDVPATVSALGEALGARPYREGGDSFAPIGDEHGLCIVVRTGRPWFPTERAAGTHPLTVALSGERDAEYELAPFPYRFSLSARA